MVLPTPQGILNFSLALVKKAQNGLRISLVERQPYFEDIQRFTIKNHLIGLNRFQLPWKDANPIECSRLEGSMKRPWKVLVF